MVYSHNKNNKVAANATIDRQINAVIAPNLALIFETAKDCYTATYKHNDVDVVASYADVPEEMISFDGPVSYYRGGKQFVKINKDVLAISYDLNREPINLYPIIIKGTTDGTTTINLDFNVPVNWNSDEFANFGSIEVNTADKVVKITNVVISVDKFNAVLTTAPAFIANEEITLVVSPGTLTSRMPNRLIRFAVTNAI